MLSGWSNDLVDFRERYTSLWRKRVYFSIFSVVSASLHSWCACLLPLPSFYQTHPLLNSQCHRIYEQLAAYIKRRQAYPRSSQLESRCTIERGDARTRLSMPFRHGAGVPSTSREYEWMSSFELENLRKCKYANMFKKDPSCSFLSSKRELRFIRVKLKHFSHQPHPLLP